MLRDPANPLRNRSRPTIIELVTARIVDRIDREGRLNLTSIQEAAIAVLRKNPIFGEVIDSKRTFGVRC
jgi:hypothetical protein